MISDNILVVAAHPDDEVLGCGGTLAKMTKEGRNVHILLLADGESSRDMKSAGGDDTIIKVREGCAHAAGKILGCSSVTTMHFPDNRLDGVELLDIVKIIESQINGLQPSTVLTHHYGDINIDHRVVHEAVMAACRPQPEHCVKELLFFEVPSSTEWRPPGSALSFHPNYFVDISTTWEIKMEALKAYQNEIRAFPHSRSLEAIESLARWRGATVGTGAAEAFILGRKVVR